MQQSRVVILGGARTPVGCLQGGLASVSATDLGAFAIKGALSKSKIKAENIDEVFMGCVLPAGLKQSPARQAAIGAGITETAGAVTINKVCGSGMQAALFANDSIVSGTNKLVVAGGMESMTNAPHLVAGARSGIRTGHNALKDHMFIDGLEDAYTGRSMGSFAQETADKYNVTREEMDAFAISSLERALSAEKTGALKEEIVSIEIENRKGTSQVLSDEQPQRASKEKIKTLKPAFSKDGTITAANTSSISDGASAIVLADSKYAKDMNLDPVAYLVGHARHSLKPNDFTLAPIDAIKKLARKVNWNLEDVDLFEINEAFAMVTILAMRELNIEHSKVNVYGGACAQGHPIGSSGSRIIVTLVNALHQLGKSRGIASLCIGGGEATAIAVQLTS